MKNSGFGEVLIGWYKMHKRSLPWRKTNDPYRIWLSEIILQQTRVAQGLPYYERFVESYPTVFSLAKAPQQEVLKLWEGLGYYSRARNMHAAAQQVLKEYNGVFPKTYTELLTLKGVGAYTAAAIASFAYNLPYAVLDGNVYRVLARYFLLDEPINTPKAGKLFSALANKLLGEHPPDLFNQSIMEFGALQCVPKNPNCGDCPLGYSCLGRKHGKVDVLPAKAVKKPKRIRWFYYIQLVCKDEVLVQQRTSQDIWKGLFQFPLLESQTEMQVDEVLPLIENRGWWTSGAKLESVVPLKAHVLSHQKLMAQVLVISIKHKVRPVPKSAKWVKQNELNNLPMPVLLRNYLNENQLPLPF